MPTTPASPGQRASSRRALQALFVLACSAAPADVTDARRAAPAFNAGRGDVAALRSGDAPALLSSAKPAAACADLARRLPEGTPPRLQCGAARRIVTQVRARLAAPARTPAPAPFAGALLEWLDPHGLWSAAPDAPTASVARGLAGELVHDLELPDAAALPCRAAGELGAAMRTWVASLREDFGRGAAAATDVSRPAAFHLALESPFEDDPVRTPARRLAAELGRRTALFARAFGPDGARIAQVAERRYLPEFSSDEWADVALVAAVRAYVALVDPHGAWAPFEEEAALHDGESEFLPPRLWGEMSRTSVGVRVGTAPAPPLRQADLVLEIDGVPTAGLSVEALDQLALLEQRLEEKARVVRVLRAGASEPITLSIELPGEDSPVDLPAFDVARVRFAGGVALVLPIRDVPDGLGEALGQLVARLPASVRGILLDLRGNGGGSMDGAAGAIGVFLPGLPLFPLRGRDGEVEVLRALAPPPQAVYHGPVAALVDGETASAAEMIASALKGYRRGPVLGGRTFGKGCVQEYFEDRAGAGVLRLTTLLFASPDGQALQSVGVAPDIALPFESPAGREVDLPGAPPPWSGPDVRATPTSGWAEWPLDAAVGRRCREEAAVCLALRRLGAERSAVARLRPAVGALVAGKPGGQISTRRP